MKARLHKEKVTVSMTREEFDNLMHLSRLTCVYGVHLNQLEKTKKDEFFEVKARVWNMICNILYR